VHPEKRYHISNSLFLWITLTAVPDPQNRSDTSLLWYES